MIPEPVKSRVYAAIQNTTDLRLLRGEIPWSLAGTDGTRRATNVGRRDRLVAWLDETLRSVGWSAAIESVRSDAGRTNKLELVLHGPDGEKEVWRW